MQNLTVAFQVSSDSLQFRQVEMCTGVKYCKFFHGLCLHIKKIYPSNNFCKREKKPGMQLYLCKSVKKILSDLTVMLLPQI